MSTGRPDPVWVRVALVVTSLNGEATRKPGASPQVQRLIGAALALDAATGADLAKDGWSEEEALRDSVARAEEINADMVSWVQAQSQPGSS